MIKEDGKTRYQRIQGVVLRYTNFKEADRMLTLLSVEKGKLSVLARGCRKAKSRFMAATELFCYGEYILYKRGDFYIMTQADIIDPFYDIRNDMDKLAYASYILDLIEEVSNPGEQDSHLFYLLLQILSYLAYSTLNPEDIAHLFEIKLIDHLGYRPILDACVACNGKLTPPLRFHIEQGGLICPKCYNSLGIGYNIQMGTVQTIRYILGMDMKRLNTIKFFPLLREELDGILSLYLEERLGKKLKTRRFIEELKQNKGDYK